MAKKKEENQPSLFDNLALEHNLELSAKVNPLEKEHSLEDLIKAIKEKLLEFDSLCPVYNTIQGIFMSGKFAYYDLMDKEFSLNVSHGHFSHNPNTEMIRADDKFGLSFSLSKKDPYKIIESDCCVLYTKEENKEYYSKEDLKNVKLDEKDLNDKLNILKLKLQNYFKGENNETRTVDATSKSETGAKLQPTSKLQSLSMGFTQPTSSNDSKESLLRETSLKQGGERFEQNETRGDEREPKETSSFRDENYRLPNEAGDREREKVYHQSCENLARNSLSDDENLAKNSQSLLKSAELIKDYEKALLELYLASKTQKELEFFHKIKNLYENLSDKFRQKDMHTKLEDKYQSQKNTLTPAQKDKMSEDFILALSTNTKMNLSEETSSFIASNLYEKIATLKESNENIEESLKNLEQLNKEIGIEIAQPDFVYAYKKKVKR